MPDQGSRPTEPPAIALAGARLAAILDSIDDAVISIALDGTILSWNPGAERMYGYPADEAIGSPVVGLVPAALRHEQERLLDRVRQGERVMHHETSRTRRDGWTIPVEVSMSPVRDPGGAIVALEVIETDITDRQRAAEAASRLGAIVESSDDAIVSKTLEGIVVTWNAAAERMYGFSAAEMVGQPIYRLIPEEFVEEERQIMRRVARGEHVAHYETVRRRRDNSQLFISLTLSPVRDATGSIVGVSSIKRDINERKRGEESLRQAAKMEAIGRLAAGLAHDFNNQLHAVSGFANFAARDAGLSAGARQDLLQIQKAAERMASLTRQLIAFARQQVLSPEILDLNTVLADGHPMLQRLIGADTDIQLAFGRGPKWVRVDRAQLVQVLMNLVINARDAMPRGGRVVVRTDTLEVSPGQLVDRIGRAIEAGAYAELAVEDTGEGIEPQHLHRIFEPFYTTKEIGQGTGLGLATVDGIVSQSGGHIQVETAVNQGTIIRILLPLTLAPEATIAAPSLAAAGRSQPRRRVLVVDDEDLVRSLVARTLQEAGYEVIKARDGREAIDCLEQVGGSIDLVLADVVMPVVAGPELAVELERRYPAIPLVWISGQAREIDGWRDEAGKEQPFLHKPIPNELLLQTVAQALNRQSVRGSER
jgi:two-component system, cell cycle sensor histidine kinase and response regulator CckA